MTLKVTHASHATVAVLDDDADLAASVTRLLNRTGFTAQAFTAPEVLLAETPKCQFACIVSDIQMGAMDGFAFAEAVRAQDACVALVFMTAWPTITHAVDAVRNHGGLDYLEKPIDEGRLTTAVHEGVSWSARQRRIAVALGSMTRRERDVFHLLVSGHSNKEVAQRLTIAVRTVEDHRAAIMAKTRANGLAQLVAISRGER